MAETPKKGLLKTALFSTCARAFAYSALFSLCMNVLMLALPLYSLQVLDRVLSSHSLETLLMLSMLAIGCFIMFGIFSTLRSVVLSRVAEWLDTEMSPKLLDFSVRRATVLQGASGSQALRDLATIKNFINGPGIGSLFDAPWAIIYLGIIYLIHPALGTVALVGGIILMGLAMLTEVTTRRLFSKGSKAAIQSMQTAEMATRCGEVIEAMGMMGKVTRFWENQNNHARSLQARANQRSTLIVSISRISRMVMQVGIMGTGAYLTLQNQMSVGGMIAASILTGRALAPFEAAIGVWKSLIAARDGYRRIQRGLDKLPDMRGTMRLPEPEGRLVVENLVFRPQTAERPILRGLNFRLEPGEILGVIGPSAAGKSTFAKLVTGIWPATSGAIRLDGADVYKWNREDFGQYIGYLPQDVELFPGTIKDNIARMDTQAPAEAVIAAAKDAGVHELILRLPRGYETEVSLGTLSLSPGQRQRIGLARALYGYPRFLVLDEPNSNLDGDGERALIQALRLAKSRGVTTVMIAHKPSLVGTVDKVLMMRDGMVESFGPRAEILQKYVRPAAGGTMQQAVGG